ncbi:hypothetical protein QE497_002728 [Acinetobacter baumannii]|uniref:hypothetical protein n=3 Tax=Acinetobacter baumannii TaxID=470 RepID=UPI00044D6B92|nr:hypothetical protein [Acinetobacter baumannii]EGY5283495.1 hypothetical protein [Acinetobacter baumannii]EIB6744354.1 hypothetical protein [Acinetobacter baumannii]EKV6299046.1 hypothetical protein [Acinetobacter baumannii]EKW9137739.1 hypothetical protein [Acinetobacter baumannii]ELB1971047.1 hypothetical protein [Acinetobacter baumannii]
MNKVLLSELQTKLIIDQGIFIQGIGFDKRCLTVLRNIQVSKFHKIIGIQNLHSRTRNTEHEVGFLNIAGDRASIVGNNSKTVMSLVDELSEVLNKIELLSTKEIYFDITSLSHEILVVLVGLLNELNLLKNTTFLYTQARQYGSWLSRGVNEIRSILGFSGLMYPSKKLHLIVLLGFELERAERVINSYEPAKITLGIGRKDHSISNDIFDINNSTKKKIENLIFSSGLDIGDVDHLDFSCLDPYLVKNQLLSYVESLSNKDEYNFIVAPLNNKISTLGVAFAGLDNQDLQICYAEAEEYNYDNYVETNDFVSILKFK